MLRYPLHRWESVASWTFSAVVHAAVGGLIAQFGGAAATWLSESNVTPGQAVTLQASFASAAASPDLTPVAKIVQDARASEPSDTAIGISPQQMDVRRASEESDVPRPVIDRGELVEVSFVVETTVVVENRKRHPVSEPQVAETGPAVSHERRERRTAPPGERENANAVDSALSPPSIAGADVPPRELATNVAPGYPADARRNGREGRVTVRMLVSAEGNVVRSHIMRSSGTPSLDAEALAAVGRWRFVPARRDGAAVEHEVEKSFRFRIEN
jgi:protein TonB